MTRLSNDLQLVETTIVLPSASDGTSDTFNEGGGGKRRISKHERTRFRESSLGTDNDDTSTLRSLEKI